MYDRLGKCASYEFFRSGTYDHNVPRSWIREEYNRQNGDVARRNTKSVDSRYSLLITKEAARCLLYGLPGMPVIGSYAGAK